MVREEIRRAWRELRGDAMSPWRGALAVALGLFIGSQPIFGCHTPLVLIFCLRFRLDAAVAWVASNISNPFFAPVLLTVEVQLGAMILTGGPIRFDVHQASFADYAGYAFAGAPAVGLGLAVIGGTATYGLLIAKRALFPNAKPPAPYRLPDHAPPWVAAVERVATRYAPTPPNEVSTPAERTRFHYVRVKLVGDPVARLIADVMGDEPGALGEVTDIGTGRGQMPILFVELGRATRAYGVDWDEEKIAEAEKARGAHGADLPELSCSFAQGDARTADFPEADTVMLIDLLHYFTIEEQDEILRRAIDAVRPGGRLLIREADADRGWRSKMTLLEERIFTGISFNRGERVRFRKATELTDIASQAGLSCRVIPAWGKTPFSNVLIVAERPVHDV